MTGVFDDGNKQHISRIYVSLMGVHGVVGEVHVAQHGHWQEVVGVDPVCPIGVGAHSVGGYSLREGVGEVLQTADQV